MRKHLKIRRFIMVRKSESINRKPLGEEVITFTDRKGREKEVTVLNSVIFTDKEKRELEDKIVDELYNIFTGKVC